MKALHLTIHGRVQGVWFRATTREMAQKYRIMGWVRNTTDGSVEAHIQGEESAVDKMLSWCRQGPPGARVDDVDVRDVDLMDDYKAFNIRYY
ncbi:MAG TPA: acylphosphatase [Deltaproteobacteria bacterium]|nr:acylphosphatase [Deltaproteobacteria bacterium]HPR53529.1 acylphosphatase [Deltaproteobacteria bacterium]HXK46134.1 acylphosphatase [Deltaproteobacteria bacterium]